MGTYLYSLKPPPPPDRMELQIKHHLEGTGKQATHYMVPQVQNNIVETSQLLVGNIDQPEPQHCFESGIFVES